MSEFDLSYQSTHAYRSHKKCRMILYSECAFIIGYLAANVMCSDRLIGVIRRWQYVWYGGLFSTRQY